MLIATAVCGTPWLMASERLKGISSGDTVTIRSDEAWEDELPNVVHFRGSFELKSGTWRLSADEATLYGTLDDPETVVLTGSPASFLIDAEVNGEWQSVSGEAGRIVFDRDKDSILMEGRALLSREENSLRGGEIEYQIEADRIRAGGEGGVQIRLEGEDSGP